METVEVLFCSIRLPFLTYFDKQLIQKLCCWENNVFGSCKNQNPTACLNIVEEKKSKFSFTSGMIRIPPYGLDESVFHEHIKHHRNEPQFKSVINNLYKCRTFNQSAF